MKLMVPTLFGSSVAQISLLFDVCFASLLASGSLTWLYYGDRLMEFPLGMFGVALSVVILPTLSSLHARNGRAEYRATLDWAVRSEEHTSELQSRGHLVCRLLLEKKNNSA